MFLQKGPQEFTGFRTGKRNHALETTRSINYVQRLDLLIRTPAGQMFHIYADLPVEFGNPLRLSRQGSLRLALADTNGAFQGAG